MSATVMNAGLSEPALAPSVKQPPANPVLTFPQAVGGNEDSFFRQQIRGLVQQVFFANGRMPIHQVVFSATEPETDVHSICCRVGETLASETEGRVAVVEKHPQNCQTAAMNSSKQPGLDLHKVSVRLGHNLWLVPAIGLGEEPGVSSATSLQSFLCELRREFEYSIVVGPSAEEWNRAASMGQLADGIILVLSAQRTRRIRARQMKETLERSDARILGTVLCDRDFPIPESVYRRL